jgi:D-alanyl-D-alanine dipeptidase
MGGQFDELSDRSHPLFYERGDLTSEEEQFRESRRALARAMAEQDFVRLKTEWWHFEFGTDLWAAETGRSKLFSVVF